jgi:hypothetical protein
MTTAIPRHDIYRFVHKALRAFMSDTLSAVGSMDPHDDAEQNAVLKQVRELLDFCQGHLRKEDHFVHSAMEERAPGSTRATAGDHKEHLHSFDDIEAMRIAVEQTEGKARTGAAALLYRKLALFVGENFVHMNVEETENNEVLWRTHSDAELIAIEQAIVASLSPQEKLFSGRWMLPVLSPAERALVLNTMRASLPPQAFAGILVTLMPRLSDANWRKLTAAIGTTDLAA